MINKRKEIKKTYKTYNPLLDLRIYYVTALMIIFIWVPHDFVERDKSSFFSGYDWIWNTESDYPINFIFLGLEFVFITVLFVLFRKK